MDQKRLHHINFKGAIFTNFSQDHLDYHKNMKSYLNAKLILFKEILEKNSKIITDKEIKEYSLSEIVFEKKKDQKLETIIKNINSSISDIGFENTANIYSIADSAKFGGSIGSIKESNLSKKIINKIEGLKEGQHSKVIQINNNFLILKIDKIELIKLEINENEELEKMIKFETNRQLNQFAKIYFSKSKINYMINEK